MGGRGGGGGRRGGRRPAEGGGVVEEDGRARFQRSITSGLRIQSLYKAEAELALDPSLRFKSSAFIPMIVITYYQ